MDQAKQRVAQEVKLPTGYFVKWTGQYELLERVRARMAWILLPILLDNAVGSDVAKRIAAPMWGSLLSLTILTLLVIPAVYAVRRTPQLALETGTQSV